MNTIAEFWPAASRCICTAVLMAILPLAGFASIVDITVRGIVAGALDTTGVFGPKGVELAGDSFALVFTFDDTKGRQTVTTINGVPYDTAITSTNSSNPGTATLSIGAGSFTFGVLNASYEANSEAGKIDPAGTNTAIYLAAGDGYYGDGSGLSGSVYAAPGTVFTTNPSWDAPFSDANLFVSPVGAGSIGFEISEFGTTGQGVSSGELIPQSISVSGPEVTITPEPGSSLLAAVGMVLVFGTAASRRKRLLTLVMPVLLSLAIASTTIAQTSDDGRPKKVQYNGQNYFVEQSPGGYSLKITPEGTPVPIGIVDLRRDRVIALDPSNYDTVKGVYDAYKNGGSTFAPPPAAARLSSRTALAPTTSASERTVTFTEAGAIVADPRYGDVTISNDGTEASYVTEGRGVTTVPTKTIVSYEGGDAPPPASEKTGKFVKGAATALLTSMSPHIVSRVGTHGNDVWKVVGEGVRGKNTLYESGSSAQGYMPANGRDPGQDIGLTILESVKQDIEAAVKAATAKKTAGENVKFDVSSDRSQRALKSLQEATKAFNPK